jgi:hypothetical protein
MKKYALSKKMEPQKMIRRARTELLKLQKLEFWSCRKIQEQTAETTCTNV